MNTTFDRTVSVEEEFLYKETPRLTEKTPKPKFYKKFFNAESAMIVGVTALTLATGALIMKLSNDQQNGVKEGITADAEANIPGFSEIEIEGTMWNMTPGSVHGAIVTLATGNTCDVQFTTQEGEGIVSSLFPDDGRITDFGTCPTIQR